MGHNLTGWSFFFSQTPLPLTIETTSVRHNGKVHSWTTELTARDRLFLEKLGMRGI